MESIKTRMSYSFLKIHSGSDLSRRRLPLMTINSPNPGPVVWLTACVHGDEVGGIVVVQEVFRLLKTHLLNGSVHAFPLMNPIGFETSSRNITVSKEDLNRSFPGDAKGSLGSRIAHRILQRILSTSPALVLDLHNDWVKSIPYIVLDLASEIHSDVFTNSTSIARQSGFIVVEETETIPGSLSYNLLDAGIPALTLELGESRVINEKNVRAGLNAIWSILAYLGMLQGPPETTESYSMIPRGAEKKIYRYSDKPYCSESGIVRFLAKLGKEVKCGQPLAKIVNAFGRQQEVIRAVQDGIVLGYTDSVVVFPGMPIIASAIPNKDAVPK